MLDLNEIRNNIDKIDSQLVELFEERMKLTTEVAEYKIETGKKVLDPAREKAKLESVKKLVKNPDNVHAIDDLFSQIMANSRKNQYMLLEKMGQTLREPYEDVLADFDRVIGLNRLKAIHLNDSKNPCGAHKDRHEQIGKGYIGLEALMRVVNHPTLKNLPFELETPNDLAGYAAEIKQIRELAE